MFPIFSPLFSLHCGFSSSHVRPLTYHLKSIVRESHGTQTTSQNWIKAYLKIDRRRKKNNGKRQINCILSVYNLVRFIYIYETFNERRFYCCVLCVWKTQSIIILINEQEANWTKNNWCMRFILRYVGFSVRHSDSISLFFCPTLHLFHGIHVFLRSIFHTRTWGIFHSEILHRKVQRTIPVRNQSKKVQKYKSL